MGDVFPSYGCAILIMIAVMIRMSRLICAVKETVRQDGSVVLGNQITDAFLSGCSVTEKMIAETIVMSYLIIVLSVIRSQTLSVPTIDVFRSEYFLKIPLNNF